jgi:hypothetical protein
LEITWQNVLLGALALVGTTALTILVTRLVNWLLERRSQLTVEIHVNEILNAKRLVDDLQADMKVVVPSWDDWRKLPFSSYDKYSKFFAQQKYLRLSITNGTSKKIAGLTLSFGGHIGGLVQIGGSEAEIVEVPGRGAVALGDLQPKRSVEVNILTSSLFATVTMLALREAIVITSDEHVRTCYKFPAPDHIEFRNRMRRLAARIILWIVFVVGLAIAGSILPIKH